MLKISQLKQYSEQVKEVIVEIKSLQLVVTVEELRKFLDEHTAEMNTLMLALAPHHTMTGNQDNAQWENLTGFYFLDKTDLSEHDHDAYLAIFERTQDIAMKFVHKLLTDKAYNEGLFCNFLAFLDEDSIIINPIKALNGCNGWYVQVAMKSNF